MLCRPGFNYNPYYTDDSSYSESEAYQANKKEKWKKIDVNISIATTAIDKEKSVFEKVEEKVVNYSEQAEVKKSYESRSFPASKPNDGIFRNYDNKPKQEITTTTGYAPRINEENSKFGRPKTDFAFGVKAPIEPGKPDSWRNPEMKPIPTSDRKENDHGLEFSGEPPKRKFYNLNKNNTPVQDPLKPKEKEIAKPSKDAWDENVKSTVRENPWYRNK